MNKCLYLGMIAAITGGILWLSQETSRELFNIWIVVSMVMVLLGAFNILVGISKYLDGVKILDIRPSVEQVRMIEWVFIIGLIFVGSMSYTLASYYHLKLKKWSFLAALAIALPFILIEYQFSIRGNHAARDILNLNAVQITLITMIFYFINSWILNHFILKQKVIWWREGVAFVLILIAFVLSTHVKRS